MPNLRPLTDDERMDIEMGKLMRKLASKPETRRELLKVVRKDNPKAKFVDQEVEDLREEMKNRVETEKIERDRLAIEARMSEQRTNLGRRYGEEQIKEIEALMQKHGLTDYDLAARLYAAEAPSSRGGLEPPGRNGTWTMPDDKALMADPRKWANDMAHKVIDEMKTQRR